MDFPRLVMETEHKGSFCYQDGYDEVTAAEIQDLLRLGRETVLSLEEELARRQMSALNALPSAVKACIEKLQTSMNTLKVVQRLDEPANLISAAAETLKTDRTNRREKIYKQFLDDVRQQCGAGLVVLSSSSLGKRRIVELKNSERISLLGYLKSNFNSFKHPILDTLAVTYGIVDAPSDPDGSSANPLTTAHSVPAERRKSSILSNLHPN
jgi:hypothetical protein